jgi:hypothetical protein
MEDHTNGVALFLSPPSPLFPEPRCDRSFNPIYKRREVLEASFGTQGLLVKLQITRAFEQILLLDPFVLTHTTSTNDQTLFNSELDIA